MSDTEQAAEAVAEVRGAVEEPAPEAAAPEAEAAAEAPAEPEAAEASDGDGAEDDPAVAAAEEELVEEAIPVPVGPAAGRQARVYLCERGHRTVAVWSQPTVCHARPTRRSECGRQLHPIGELPEQVQKALNPLKASKKASKG
jgi:hypothetical protein